MRGKRSIHRAAVPSLPKEPSLGSQEIPEVNPSNISHWYKTKFILPMASDIDIKEKEDTKCP